MGRVIKEMMTFRGTLGQNGAGTSVSESVTGILRVPREYPPSQLYLPQLLELILFKAICPIVTLWAFSLLYSYYKVNSVIV